jgi:hypothetical protein
MAEHPRKTRPDPNAADPLSEPTVNRRLWAAYLNRGFNRRSFSRAMGSAYSTVDDWDTGKRMPQLDNLIRAREVLEVFTLDELAFGHNPPQQQRIEKELGRDAIKLLLRELTAGIDPATALDWMEALGEYERSAAGQYTMFTRSYICAFIDTYASARADGEPRKRAVELAKTIAINARATVEAVAMRLLPVSEEQLRQMGEALRADWAKPQEPEPTAPDAKVTALPRARKKSRRGRSA